MNKFKTSSLFLWMKYLTKYSFRNCDETHLKNLSGEKSWSQTGQDLFALFANQRKQQGTYVEIGAHDPFRDNNSYLLERDYNWHGVSYEVDERYAYFFNRLRANPCILADATQVNYEEEFSRRSFPKQIDYLQIDIDPAHQSLSALKALPLHSYRFNAITFEHDRYQAGDDVMVESRKILNDLGYVLLFPNIQNIGLDVEDWWVDPTHVRFDLIALKQKTALDFKQAIELLVDFFNSEQSSR